MEQVYFSYNQFVILVHLHKSTWATCRKLQKLGAVNKPSLPQYEDENQVDVISMKANLFKSVHQVYCTHINCIWGGEHMTFPDDMPLCYLDVHYNIANFVTNLQIKFLMSHCVNSCKYNLCVFILIRIRTQRQLVYMKWFES